MVTPSESMELVALAVDRSNRMPDDTSYLLHEADPDGEDADVSLPLIEIEAFSADHVNPHNTDFVDYVIDENNNRVGRVYYAEYELELEVDVWVADGSSHDVDELGDNLREALYKYDSYGPQEPLLDADGNPIDSIFRFTIEDGERQDSLIETPTVRRWRHTVEVWGFEEFKTTEDYIVDIDAPSSGDETTDSDGVIDV